MMNITIGIDPGHGRTYSEDTAFCNGYLRTDGTETLTAESVDRLGVCDGVGGNAGGRVASEFVCRALSAGDFSRMGKGELREFLERLNRDLLAHAATCPGQETMATTCSCIFRGLDGFYLIHAGNTRVCALQGGYLRQLTEDHTHKARLLRAGQTEAAAATPGNRIYCALGGGNAAFAGSLSLRKLEGDLPATLVLTTDGIHDHLTLDELEMYLAGAGTDPERCRRIIDAARAAGSDDDCTLIIARQE